MPFKTKHGNHYHLVEGCHGATIPCSTEGLEPCSDCCGGGTGSGPDGAGAIGGSAPGAGVAGGAADDDLFGDLDLDWDDDDDDADDGHDDVLGDALVEAGSAAGTPAMPVEDITPGDLGVSTDIDDPLRGFVKVGEDYGGSLGKATMWNPLTGEVLSVTVEDYDYQYPDGPFLAGSIAKYGLDTIDRLRRATPDKEAMRDFWVSRGRVFEGATVTVTKGRKVPCGVTGTVTSTREIYDRYGRDVATYATIRGDDGKTYSTNIANLTVTGREGMRGGGTMGLGLRGETHELYGHEVPVGMTREVLELIGSGPFIGDDGENLLAPGGEYEIAPLPPEDVAAFAEYATRHNNAGNDEPLDARALTRIVQMERACRNDYVQPLRAELDEIEEQLQTDDYSARNNPQGRQSRQKRARRIRKKLAGMEQCPSVWDYSNGKFLPFVHDYDQDGYDVMSIEVPDGSDFDSFTAYEDADDLYDRRGKPDAVVPMADIMREADGMDPFDYEELGDYVLARLEAEGKIRK